MNIPLGYEIGAGRRVSIPVNHTVVLGQTQLSGKTTTLEAMVTRSGLRAIGFITKPGEKSFRLQTSIPAYFSESTISDYWKYVVSIVENLMSVKLGWQERGWIVKLCQDYADKTKHKAYKWKRPKTLGELLGNCETALPHLRGTSEMICMQLEEYLTAVVREIGETEFSSKLDLKPGINVMDVTELSDGLKALVIRSVIEQVHKHMRRVIVIIPEAWKFIPEGRSTPVKLALEGLIREGAGVGNFVWMDSQDLRGVDKNLLRSMIVWLFGVQRQKNEVANTLASIPDPKPSATEIMQLGKGEFYVSYGQTIVRTYVQPAGMEDAHAQAIARGEESPDSWRQIAKALDEDISQKEEPVQQPSNRGINSEAEEPAESSDRASAYERAEYCSDIIADEVTLRDEDQSETLVSGSEDEKMWKEKYDELLSEHGELIKVHDIMAERLRIITDYIGDEQLKTLLEKGSSSGGAREGAAPSLSEGIGGTQGPPIERGAAEQIGRGSAAPQFSEAREAIYRYVIDRATKDPRVLAILTNRPELRVTIQRETIEASAGTLRGALALLISKKFFDSPQNGNSAFNELKRLGRSVAKPNVYRELDKLAELGFVTKEPSGYQAVPGMRVNIVDSSAEASAKAEKAAAR